ncbi:MAG: NADH-quinone oxidoreductase subunit L [Acidobacteriaceae bacterium]
MIKILWLIPAIPVVAAGFIALLKQGRRKVAATAAISALGISLILSVAAFVGMLSNSTMQVVNFCWLQFGSQWISLGWLLDPLAAIMLVMVSFVGLLIFIYSLGYMAEDENFTRFYCFLSLFAGAMLAVVIANSLLLLFMGWELVGLTSYLLIGFWYHKPEAAAAAKKAFIVTRVGDLGLLLGMVWLYGSTGTLLFYNHGAGCLEQGALASLVGHTTIGGMAVSTAVALLIFLGAMGKSGQVPLHIWLPDAMEGPTPVSALIHAATMVAAGVYLIARVYPLMSAAATPGTISTALQVVAWIGAITAFFAACIAVAQDDIKRILAYSTVSQLGYMMLGLGVGGVAVGMFHLITHACFKALLFLGAGSVIHGCAGEQDIRKMGGLRRFMPVTFLTYAAGMLALCGFPLFAGFWSKDEILHAAHGWPISLGPFYLGTAGALLTAFYMTRQVYYVFLGSRRTADEAVGAAHGHAAHGHGEPHESPLVMTVPMVVLGFLAAFLGLIGMPAWPWFSNFLTGQVTTLDFGRFAEAGLLPLMLVSSVMVFLGLGLGWWFYGRKPIVSASQPDGLEQLMPPIFGALRRRLYVDELYGVTVIPLARLGSVLADAFDRFVLGGLAVLTTLLVNGLGHIDNSIDTHAVNGGFDLGSRGLATGGRWFAAWQSGRVQTYLRTIAIALVVFAVMLLWWDKA